MKVWFCPRAWCGLAAAVLLANVASLLHAADEPGVAPAVARLRSDVSYLADDARGGRGVGTPGIDEAADYIAGIFQQIGLQPAPGAEGYFQPFSIRGEARVGQPTDLAFGLPDGMVARGELGKTFAPLAVGSAGKFEESPVVFAGFGITAKDSEKQLDYDDYAGIDAKDKVVLILRREPEPKDQTSPFAGEPFTSYATFTHKAINAAEHGARAVLLVNDEPSAAERDQLLDYGATPAGGAVPFIMITRATADELLKAAGAPRLAELERSINETGKPQSRELDGITAQGQVTIAREPIRARNVVGVLEGRGPHADETIVVGGHYDHLGMGGLGSLAFGTRAIHNGADDNASGTATVIELARRLAARPDPPPRRVVFMLFSGEERGLLGSAHYVNQPLFPLDKTVAMLNFDMVGRYEDDKGLTIYGGGTSEGFGPLVEGLAKSLGLNPKLARGVNDGFSDSDHSSFYRKDIPILFFFTGTHPDYHRPSDDSDRINYEGMARVADLGELMLLNLLGRPERPTFVKAPAAPRREVGAVRVGGGAYLGSRPSYGDDVEGVKLDGVSDGSPAEKAGLKGGDIIVRFAGLPVRDIESYMTALSSKKPGDTVEIVVQRGEETVTLKATLGSRPSRPMD
jgi:hypothetical protein